MTLDELQKENEKTLAENKKLSEKVESLSKALAAKETELLDGKKALAEVDKLNATVVAMQADACIGKALAEGRILPKDKEFWQKQYIDMPAKAEEIIAKLPVSVMLGEEGTEGASGEESSDPATVLDKAARVIMASEKVNYADAIKIAQRNDKTLAEKVRTTNYRERR